MLVLLALIPLLAAASPVQKRATGQLIQASRDGLCLSVQGDIKTAGSGTPVISVPCNQASLWDISPGKGSVIATGTGLALDAGSNPGNNGPLKVWQSYPGLYQQTWFLTGDNRIAIYNGNQCLDEGTAGIQTYQCTTGNTNQIFFVKAPGPKPSSSSSASSASASPTPPSSTRYKNQLIYAGRDNLCITPDVALTAKSSITAGTAVVSRDCSTAFTWDISDGSSSVILTGTNFALDAGSYPGNNGALKVWTSYPGLYQQTWYLTPDDRIAITGGNQCLDEGDNGVQTYQCTTGNTNQIWGHRAGSPASSSSKPVSASSSSMPASASSSSKTAAASSTSKAAPASSSSMPAASSSSKAAPVSSSSMTAAASSSSKAASSSSSKVGATSILGK